MKSKLLYFLGLFLVALPFLVIFVFISIAHDIYSAIALFGICAIVVCTMYIGIALMMENRR